MKGKISKIAIFLPREAIIWTVALVLLAFCDPNHNAHFSFCILHYLGIEWCPGCGLGRSIAFLLNGQIQESLKMHPFGIVATILLAHRIFLLCYRSIYYHNNTQNGKCFRNTP